MIFDKRLKDPVSLGRTKLNPPPCQKYKVTIYLNKTLNRKVKQTSKRTTIKRRKEVLGKDLNPVNRSQIENYTESI